jgi:hypothetical protein
MAGSVADVLDRRTRASLRDARGAADAARRVAELIGPELGWERARIDGEAQAYTAARHAELVRAGLEVGPGPEDSARPAPARTVAAGTSEPG